MVLIAPDIRGGAVPYPVAVEILPGSVMDRELRACVYAGGVAGEMVGGGEERVLLNTILIIVTVVMCCVILPTAKGCIIITAHLKNPCVSRSIVTIVVN